jgi:hypothetical protein
MLIISASGSTTITTTFQQQAVNKVNPFFTWELTQKGTNQSIIFTADDISTSPNYWNQYVITVAATVGSPAIGLTSGVIPLQQGEYHYSAWEMTNQYDLNISDAIGKVDDGIMVVGLTFSIATSTMSDNSIINNPIPVSTLT